MTLHEAIIDLLRAHGAPMDFSSIARQINAKGTYQRGDGGPLPSSQIRLRVKNYPRHFFVRDGFVYLNGWAELPMAPASAPTATPTIERRVEAMAPPVQADASSLLAPASFRSCDSYEAMVPNRAGLYCIKIKDRTALPSPYAEELGRRGTDVIYIGIATVSLATRLAQELRARGHGTFFRSLGAVLGFQPAPGSLVGKANTRNYKFTSADTQAILEWIDANLLVNWIEVDSGFGSLETILIAQSTPLLNLDKNPLPFRPLKEARRICVDVANGR
jgi:hypothetical protein